MKASNVDLEKQGSDLVKWLQKNIIPIFLTILSIYFLFSGAVKFQLNELNWWEKICFICTTLIFGIVISSLVSEGGYTAGKRDPDYIATRQTATILCEEMIAYKEGAELYVSKKIDRDILEDKKEILHKAGVKFHDIFDENNVVIYDKKKDKKKYSKKQRREIRRAIHIKKVEFVLFGFGSAKIVGRKEAPNEIKRRKSQTMSNFALRSIMAVVTGSVMFAWLGLSWATVLYSFFQLMTWYGSGLVQRVGNFNFIVNDIRSYDLERIWYLKEFKALPQQEKDSLLEEAKKKLEAEKSKESVEELQPCEIEMISEGEPEVYEQPREDNNRDISSIGREEEINSETNILD